LRHPCSLHTTPDLTQDIADQKERISGLQSDISELESAEEDIRAQLEKSTDSGLKLGASDVKEYSLLREQVSSQIARENVIKSNIELDLKSKHELIKRYTAQMDTTVAEGTSGDNMIEECEHRYKLLSGAVSACTAEQKALLAARGELGEYLFCFLCSYICRSHVVLFGDISAHAVLLRFHNSADIEIYCMYTAFY